MTQNDRQLNEMLTFIPLCTHENPVDVLFLGFSQLPQFEILKNLNATAASHISQEMASSSYDAIISTANAKTQDIFRLLKPDGIYVATAGESIEAKLGELGNFFRIVMPYFETTLIFASNKYHPTADIVLDRSDFIEDNEYYNSEIHLASFALTQKTKKRLKGLAKN